MKIEIDTNGLPILSQFSEEGFVDLVFEIQQVRREHGYIFFHLAASHDGMAVGLDVRIITGFKAGFDSKMNLDRNNVFRDGVQFRRSGPESDRLLRAIARLYEQGAEKMYRMVESESFTAIALHQGSIDMESEPIKVKIFGRDREEDEENDYYESFFNLDLKNGLVFWNEKDQDYRAPLLRGLGILVDH
jgi:hypothetical protein